ncbi:pH-response regulator protein palH/rim21 [Lecanora helva]
MGSTAAGLLPRQIWVDPSPTSNSLPHTCTPFRLYSGGQINVGHGNIVTLTQDAAFQPKCAETPVPSPIDLLQPGADLSGYGTREPWYASTIPQIYAISAVTIVSYMLVIILFITPRTFFVGGAGGGGGFLGQSGVNSGAYGNNLVIGIGSRPWLQKLAALTVAISMTIVTADTFTWAQRQYDASYQNANELTSKVIGGLEIRIVRVISETFLWLAQAQTLIRLFPRHKEKLLIKWLAFALIVLELIFSCLNHFLVNASHSKKLVSAIPAMNYLFALTLNLCYGGFIIYYALQKRRFAFYHPHMQNMPLVALLSLTAILIPVVFFVIDLSSPNISGWGSYVRWVGSAAASVVVWEWVERIEALERDEKKGGILGREIFDGDEMLDVTAGSDANWPSSQTLNTKGSRRNSGSGFGLSTGWSTMAAKARKMGHLGHLQGASSKNQSEPSSSLQRKSGESRTGEQDYLSSQILHPALAPAVVASSSRADTSSPASTSYVVRRHTMDGTTPPIPDEMSTKTRPPLRIDQRMRTWVQESQELEASEAAGPSSRRRALMEGLQRVPNPFRRQRETPPPEVARALAERSQDLGEGQTRDKERSGMLERLHMKKISKASVPSRPVIVVQPPSRRRKAWSQELDEDEDEDSGDDSQNPIRLDQPMSAVGVGVTDKAADMPPDAVINAMSTSNSVSPLPDHPEQ